MSAQRTFLAELRRRNVPRAAVLYAGAVWALAQGIAQLSPFFGAPGWIVRWFVIACVIGFPFWLAFAWYYQITLHGIRREPEEASAPSTARVITRRLDYWIIGVLAVAVVLLITNTFVLHRDVTSRADATSAKATAAALAELPAKSIAVLPFINESGDPKQQYFSDGLSEDLITALSQFAGLKVISRQSAFEFRNSKDSSAQIGLKLGVAHLLEGAVQRAGDEVRITATLVNAANGSTLWSEHYDRPYKDLFALQDAITKAVASRLKAKLLTTPGAVVQSDRPPSGNLAAYAAYHEGQANVARFTLQGFHNATSDYRRATQLDPRYALAYASLARSWVSRYRSGHTQVDGPRDMAQARATIKTALTLDPHLAAAHAIHAFLLYSMDFDWYGAQAEYRRALQLAPNDVQAKTGLARVSALLGHHRTAIALQREALAADPRSARGWWSLGGTLVAIGQLDAAEQADHKALALNPHAIWTYERLAVIAVLRGHAQRAMQLARKEPSPDWHSVGVALAAQIGPDRAAADAALQNLITHGAKTSAYQIAEVYALREDPDAMFKWLDRAWMQRDAGIVELLSDPFILHYQHDPRFAAFCKKVGLPSTTDAVAMK